MLSSFVYVTHRPVLSICEFFLLTSFGNGFANVSCYFGMDTHLVIDIINPRRHDASFVIIKA